MFKQISQMREEFYNFKTLVSDSNSDVPKYGKYTFYCADNGKDSTNFPADIQQCIFDGKTSTTDNENSLLLMRKAKLSSGFKFDNFYAKNEHQLDFIVAFYSGQMDCESDPCKHSNIAKLRSASLIHGYTISDSSNDSTQWDGLFYNYVNYWQQNDGMKIPTFFRLFKNFHASKIVDHNAIGVFFDNSIQLSFENDYDEDHSYHCTSYTNEKTENSCELVKGTTFDSTGNWRHNQGVIFKNTAIIEGEKIELLVPVETLSKDPVYLTIVLFSYDRNSNSQKSYETKAVYKVRGTVDLDTDLTHFQTNGDANIGVALGRNGGTATGGNVFKYGVEEYDIANKIVKFTPTITGETETDIDFSSNPNQAGIASEGAGLTISSQKIDIFGDDLKLNLDSSGNFRCFKVQLGEEYYSLYCPFADNGMTLLQKTGSDIGIDIIQSGFPIAFHVDNIFTYGYSGISGAGEAVYSQTKSIAPSVTPSCSLQQVE